MPPEAVWEVLADIGRIHEWNPGVLHSEQTSEGDVDVGARRHCDIGGKNYLDERVFEFEPPTRLTISIEDTNLPLRDARVRFPVESAGGGTRVRVSPSYSIKFGLLGRLLDVVMIRSQYRRGIRSLLDGLKTYVESGSYRAA